MLLESIVKNDVVLIPDSLFLDSFSSPLFLSTDLLISYHCLVNRLLLFFIVLVRLLVALLGSRATIYNLHPPLRLRLRLPLPFSIIHHPSSSKRNVVSNTSLLSIFYLCMHPLLNLLALRSSSTVAPSLSHITPPNKSVSLFTDTISMH